MSMEKEWKELKAWAEGRTAVMAKMSELEKRSLPERVAELLEKFDTSWISAINAVSEDGPPLGWPLNMLPKHVATQVVSMIREALRTGDTSELEKWQK